MLCVLKSSDLVCLYKNSNAIPLFRNHKVVGVVNCSKENISAAQSREKPMTLKLIDKLTGEEGKHKICINWPRVIYHDFRENNLSKDSHQIITAYLDMTLVRN